MTTPYLRDLLDQPSAIRDTLTALRSQPLFPQLPRQVVLGELSPIFLTGMGSSYHVFHPLHQALLRTGISAHMVETSELLYTFDPMLVPDTLVIAMSQSGRSVEVVTLAERKAAYKAERNFHLIGVTNTPDSPLAQGADKLVLTQAGDEATVSCKTYLASLMALAWLHTALTGGRIEDTLRDLEAAAPAVEAYLAGWQAHVSALEQRLVGVRDVFITGRGASLAAAGTGGLILKEAAHVHSEGMSSPAFRHGPMEMLSPEAFVLVYEGSGPAAELNRRLYADALSAGGRGALVSENAPEPVFRLPTVPEIVRPIVEILPVQMMTLALANLKGHEAGHFTIGSKITSVE